jgi:hypothetical protein
MSCEVRFGGPCDFSGQCGRAVTGHRSLADTSGVSL